MRVIFEDLSKEETLFRFKMDGDGLLIGDFGNRMIKEDTPGEFYNVYNGRIDKINKRGK